MSGAKGDTEITKTRHQQPSAEGMTADYKWRAKPGDNGRICKPDPSEQCPLTIRIWRRCEH